MTTQEAAYTEIERLVKSFKDMPAAQRKKINEMHNTNSRIPRFFMFSGLALILVFISACGMGSSVTQPPINTAAPPTPKPTLDPADLTGDWRAVMTDQVTLEFQVKDGLVTAYNMIYDVTTGDGCRIHGHLEELINAPIIDGYLKSNPDDGFSLTGVFYTSDRAFGRITMKPMTTGCGGVNVEDMSWMAKKISNP